MNWIIKRHWQIIIGLTLGFIRGILAPLFGLQEFTTEYIKSAGTIFIRLLQLVAISLVLASLTVGISRLGDLRKLSHIGGRTIAILRVTTTIVLSLKPATVNLTRPGRALPNTCMYPQCRRVRCLTYSIASMRL